MYKDIMVAVDLKHLDTLEKSLQVAGDLAKHYDAVVHYVSVGASYPTLGHKPHEFAGKLQAFAEGEAEKFGVTAKSHPISSIDPTVELDSMLIKAIDDTDSDLVIMGSHRPGLAEYFFASNAGYVASHARASVMVVR